MSASARVELGKRLRDRRVALGLRQGDVGAPFVTHAYVSLIETGKRWPSERILEHILSVLDLPRQSVEDLVDVPRESDALERAEWLINELERLLGPMAQLDQLRGRVGARRMKVVAG